MPVFNVTEATTNEKIPAGAHPAIFVEIEDPKDGEHGLYYTFVFQSEDGKKTYKGFANVVSAPTPKNKLGRWLCALAGSQPNVMSVNPDEFVGKKYLLVYAENQEGKVGLNTFS